MGQITVDVTPENPIGRGVCERGSGEEVDIRRTSIKATVDTGAVIRMFTSPPSPLSHQGRGIGKR